MSAFRKWQLPVVFVLALQLRVDGTNLTSILRFFGIFSLLFIFIFYFIWILHPLESLILLQLDSVWILYSVGKNFRSSYDCILKLRVKDTKLTPVFVYFSLFFVIFPYFVGIKITNHSWLLSIGSSMSNQLMYQNIKAI